MKKNEHLIVNEIFYSIQGESTAAGHRCIFVRLTGCPLKCKWCDSPTAREEGYELTIDNVIRTIEKWNCKLVEITGGEPLMQKHSLILMRELLKMKYQVMLETSGTLSIREVPGGVKVVMDVKCPSSGESHKNLWDNMDFLKKDDEVKFVIADREDYEFAKDKLKGLMEAGMCCEVLFSPVWNVMDAKKLAEWILDDHLCARLQVQLHKMIWGDVKGK